ncbi:MAG: hypothetical protein WCO78_01645 [Candidatus Roizmanbacteria bacterium]
MLVIVLGVVYLVRKPQLLASDNNSIASYSAEYSQPLSEDIINCEFKIVSDFSFTSKGEATGNQNSKIYYGTKENKPMLITFASLTSDKPKIKGNNGDGPVSILNNDDETITIAEKNDLGDTFIYTIFKKEKVATWYKGYKLLTTPFGMLSMGYCY